MISVHIYRNENKDITSFTMKGHADYAPHGQDLVCAAASAVSFGMINAIEKLCRVEPAVQLQDDGGFLSFHHPHVKDPDTYQKIQLLLEGMIVSLETIQEGYRKYIQITEHKGGATNA